MVKATFVVVGAVVLGAVVEEPDGRGGVRQHVTPGLDAILRWGGLLAAERARDAAAIETTGVEIAAA